MPPLWNRKPTAVPAIYKPAVCPILPKVAPLSLNVKSPPSASRIISPTASSVKLPEAPILEPFIERVSIERLVPLIALAVIEPIFVRLREESITVVPAIPIEDATFKVLPIAIAVLNVGAELNTTVPVIVPPARGSLVLSAAPTSITDADPSSFLIKTLPSYVLIAISPSSKSDVLGVLPETAERFSLIVCAMWLLRYCAYIRKRYFNFRMFRRPIYSTIEQIHSYSLTIYSRVQLRCQKASLILSSLHFLLDQ